MLTKMVAKCNKLNRINSVLLFVALIHIGLFVCLFFMTISPVLLGLTCIAIIIKMWFHIILIIVTQQKIIYYKWWYPSTFAIEWFDFHSPVTHAGPGMVNNPDLAFVKNVLAVAPKVAAMVNLFLKLPKKLIGLKRKTSWY